MFQLQPPREPEWRTVAEGIRFRFRFGPTEALNAARRSVRAALRLDEAADADFAYVAGAVIWGVVEWEGIGLPAPAEGTAPLIPENVVGVLSQRPDIFDDVARFYVDPLSELLSEKKGSSPSPNGISAAGPDTARPVPSSAKPAPTPSKPRARKRATGSGAPSKAAPDSSASA